MTDTAAPAASTARGRNPLAFLEAEIEDLRAKGLFRRLRVVESEQKSRCVIDGREVITLSSNNYLGLNTIPGCAGGDRRGRALRAGRRGAHHRRHHEPARGAGGAAGRVQARRGGADVPVRLHLQHRRHPDPGAGWRGDRERRAEPRQHHRRDPADQGRAQDLPARRHGRPARRAARGAGSPVARIGPCWSSPTACSAWTATSPSCRPSWTPPRRRRRSCTWTTRMRPACSAATGAAASTTSTSTAASTSRSGRCPRRIGVLGGYVAGPSVLRHHAGAPGAALPVLDVASAGRRGRLPGRHRRAGVGAELIDRLWENSRFFKAGFERLGFDTGASETPITPVIAGSGALAMKLSDRLFEEGLRAGHRLPDRAG